MIETVKKYPLLFFPLFLFTIIFIIGTICSCFTDSFQWFMKSFGWGWILIFSIGLISEGIRALSKMDIDW